MNITEYVVQYRNVTFDKKPLSEVDGLVFSELSYYTFSMYPNGVYLKDLTDDDIVAATSTRNLETQDRYLLKAIRSSKRFKDVFVCNQYSDFDPALRMQFSVTVFMLAKGKYIVAFRGTDGTCLGWREDLDMTYAFPIPSQKRGEQFLRGFLKDKKVKEVIVVGHSKGGNVAVYASATQEPEEQDKIIKCFNYDGPGFVPSFYKEETYLRIKSRIYKFIPPQSFVGRLMREDSNFKVVASDEKYLMQHWAHSWAIKQNGEFEYLEKYDNFSKNVYIAANELLMSYTPDERRLTVNALFDMFDKANIMYIDDIYEIKEARKAFFDEFVNMQNEERRRITNFIGRVIKLSSESYLTDRREDLIKDFREFLVSVKDAGLLKYIQEKGNSIKDKIDSKNNSNGN